MTDTYEGGDAMTRSRSTVKPKDDLSIQGLPMLEHSHALFDELTQRHYINTTDKEGADIDVISMVVSYDSAYLVAACSNNDESFNIIGYSLGTFK